MHGFLYLQGQAKFHDLFMEALARKATRQSSKIKTVKRAFFKKALSSKKPKEL